MDYVDYGQLAYEEYSRTASGKSLVTGQPLPDWKELSPDIQDAWRNAAGIVIIRYDENRPEK
jgi:hypothetical protein